MKKKIDLEKDIIDFIRLCNKHEVNYLVIGGYAVSIHGYPRSTKDIDVCIELSELNAVKMVEVIRDFGFSSLKFGANDFFKKNFITQIGFPSSLKLFQLSNNSCLCMLAYSTTNAKAFGGR